ncbi:phosphoenolpyruvate--protein phosphotransferase [Robbsia sp. Bb-Pol-6]|uniref:phosphoenolpyruvate--protein phosphotransferase n=1 Tax=Robbsia betulipollinis TaxID=2981849 RepID=A0ABT3ZR72_9BURK|nr:phosphoenolpyruvate--protein phosphotransferase [Robbsia betulipollinis]MCY0389049.1 phosphoenolpyruvate--protein phosphotransferase [Robbsia betulipollinis]
MALLLTPDLVRLGARAADKRDAIAQAGQLLVDAGRILPGYLDSLAAREAVANTYLGSGVAIPHGMPDDRHLIRHTGIAILQLPEGVEWQPGEQVRLVFAIAAQSDEHIGLLQRLTRAIGDPRRLQAMVETTDPARLIALLEGTDEGAAVGMAGVAPDGDGLAAPAGTPVPEAEDFDERIELVLDYPSGLHARPASAWVATAKRQPAELRVRVGTAVADPTSLIGLLQLGAVAGATLVISARGERAADALAALRRTIEMLAVEEHERAAAARARQPQSTTPLWQPLDAALTIAGLGVGPGMTLGRVRVLRSHAAEIADTPGDLLDDTHRLDAALAATDADLVALARSTTQRFGAAEGEIFEAQRGLVRHAEALDEVARALLDGHGLGWAWHRAMARQAGALASAADPLLAGRAADVRDVARRVSMHIDRLGGGADAAQSAMPVTGDAPEATILLAEDLTPSDTAALDPATTLGFCTVAGGPTSHTAILARTLGVPAAVACGPRLLTVADGAFAVLDGTSGRLHLDVSAADLARARAQIAELDRARRRAQDDRALPARTQDGLTFEIGVNVTRPEQVRGALDQGADGVGLMRTEFLFLERQTAPDEDEQYATYRALVEASNGRHLIIRTLDIGGDKQVPYLNLPHETNPFLGVRGLRLCLRRPDLFIPQLRALYRAAMHGPLWIMFPMVSTLDEAHRAVALAETVRAELDAPRVPLGIMVETPSAAVLADLFAEVVDFFSIGTNDLTQYTLAIDREHPEIAAQADSLHPAVLRLIRQTVDGARRHAKWVGVCGGLAGDPLGASILAGLGVDELSMSAGDIGAVKARLRASHGDALRALADRALACADVAAVRALPLPPLTASASAPAAVQEGA